MADAFGVDIEFAPELTWVGHSNRRLHAHPTRGGPPIVSRLREHIGMQKNVPILNHARATGRILEGGIVVGVTGEKAGRSLRIGAECVALTTGGFSANKYMLAEYIPEMADAPNIGSKCDNGDGIRWGHAEGAALSLMSGYQGRDCIFEDGARVTPPVLNEGGIAINATGRKSTTQQPIVQILKINLKDPQMRWL